MAFWSAQRRGERRAKRVRSTAKLCVSSTSPRAWISGSVENAVHHDLPGFDLVEDGVRESPNQRSADGRIDERERLRMALDCRKTGIDGSEKVGRAIGRLPVVPEVSLIEIKLSLRREAESFHLRRRSLARTCAQDFAADGLRAWARRRR